jgi:sugar phosphate isomerase/epimerase
LCGKVISSKSVTVHLPLEIQHPKHFVKIKWAKRLIDFGEFWKRALKIPLYWENAPLLNEGTWDLVFGQTKWHLVPGDIDLCLDMGHLMLGAKSVKEARGAILKLLKKKGKQVKHLHLHENNFIHDTHNKPGKVLTNSFLKRIKKGRTFIYEK